jgi:hypothetical protein
MCFPVVDHFKNKKQSFEFVKIKLWFHSKRERDVLNCGRVQKRSHVPYVYDFPLSEWRRGRAGTKGPDRLDQPDWTDFYRKNKLDGWNQMCPAIPFLSWSAYSMRRRWTPLVTTKVSCLVVLLILRCRGFLQQLTVWREVERAVKRQAASRLYLEHEKSRY